MCSKYTHTHRNGTKRKRMLIQHASLWSAKETIKWRLNVCYAYWFDNNQHEWIWLLRCAKLNLTAEELMAAVETFDCADHVTWQFVSQIGVCSGVRIYYTDFFLNIIYIVWAFSVFARFIHMNRLNVTKSIRNR